MPSDLPTDQRLLLSRADTPPVILASRSAARARLLAAAGLEVSLRPAAVDEDAVKEAARAEGTAPADAAVALAELKAMQVARAHAARALVIGADQILVTEDGWLDKPRHRAEARAQLAGLRGRRHELVTAAVVVGDGARLWHHVDRARLWMRPFSDEFLDRYLDAVGDDVLGSVGAYQVEGPGAQLFSRIEGDHFVVQGLPLLPLLEFLRVRRVLLT